MLDFGTTVTRINEEYSGKITGRAEYDTGVILYLIEFTDHEGQIIEMWLSKKEFKVNT